MKKHFRLTIFICMVFVMSIIVTYTTKETVNAATKSVELTATNLSLCLGQQKKLMLKGTDKKVTWESSNGKVVRVSKYGVVKTRRVGFATVTARVGKKTYTCDVTVKKPVIVMEDYFKGYYYALFSDGFSVECYTGDMKMNQYQDFYIWGSYEESVGAVYEESLANTTVRGYNTKTEQYSKLVPFEIYSAEWCEFQTNYYYNMDFGNNLKNYTIWSYSVEGYCLFKKNRNIDALKYNDGLHKATLYM